MRSRSETLYLGLSFIHAEVPAWYTVALSLFNSSWCFSGSSKHAQGGSIIFHVLSPSLWLTFPYYGTGATTWQAHEDQALGGSSSSSCFLFLLASLEFTFSDQP